MEFFDIRRLDYMDVEVTWSPDSITVKNIFGY